MASLLGLYTLYAQSANAQSQAAPAPTFANYGFASELGSGVYSIGGRTVQIYQIPLKFTLRPASPDDRGTPGINLTIPLTVGFFNFQTQDVAQLKVPNQVGEMSIEPGAELDYRLSDIWHIYPYIKAGGAFASAAASDALIYDVGVRSDYEFQARGGTVLYRADLTRAGVHYTAELHGGVPRNDSFSRLRDAVEWRRNIGWSIRDRHVELSPYGIADFYIDPPSASALGITRQALQFETGVMLGVSPMWQIHGITLPRIGISYRIAGAFSGWRLSIGDPF
jgi:hypothetical protein